MFVKVAAGPEGAEDLRREATVLRLLGGRIPGSAPRLVGWSERETALSVEALPGGNLAERIHSDRLLDVGLASSLGAALRRLHDEGRDIGRGLPAASTGPVGDHRPTPADMRRFSAGAMEVIVLLQRASSLCTRLDRLCVPPPAETLIHADVRMENVMVGGPAGVRLVDWEYSGCGEGLWDVAMAMAWCVSAWLSSIPQIPAVSPDRLMSEAALPLDGFRPGLGAMWRSYRDGLPDDGGAALRRCLELVSVRLVQIAVEAARDSEDLRAVSAMHLQLADNLLERPEALSRRLLGLALADG